ncbi:thioester domain-containing protein [Actinophytocola sediminis]
MASRLKAARAGVAAVGAAVTLMMTAAIPAAAEPATGFPDGAVDGYHVDMGDGKLNEILAKLIGFRVADGSKLDMYCVEIRTNLDHKREMAETPWDEYPAANSPFHANRDRINWVLHHSYPVVERETLEQTLTDAGVELHGGLNRQEAITGTQAAIWHLSDGVDLNREDPLPGGEGQGFAADVLALYDYLIGDANVGIGDQPTPALEVSPTELAGKSGERIGPFTVTTTGSVSELKAELPDGVRITDVDGKDLDARAITDGTELYLDVPADAPDGEVSIELTANATLDTGRLFVGIGYAEAKTQSLIVAKAARSEITVTAGAKWTTPPPSTETTTPPPTTETSTTTPPTSTTSSEAPPVPQPRNTSGLADTGASVFAPIMIGVVLVAAGVGALLFLRRRRRA